MELLSLTEKCELPLAQSWLMTRGWSSNASEYLLVTAC